MDLPDDVRAALVEAAVAYVRRASTQDLPKKLRRLQGFRPRALARHSEELLELLEDEIQRKLFIQALDDGVVRLSKRNEAVARVALERSEDWESRLVEMSELPSEPRPEPRDFEGELAQERQRVKGARDEARKVKSAARSELEQARRRNDELERRLASVEEELGRARAQLDRAAADAERVRAAAERRERRNEREVEKARAAAEAHRTEAKDLRKEVARLTRELAPPPPEKPRTRRAKSVVEPVEPRERTPLKVPKGLFAESRETLDLWLNEPHVSLLIDGYNVSKSQGGFGDLSLEHQRNRLIDEVDRLVRTLGVPATIVFDGAQIEPGIVRRARRTVVVAYSRPPESADDHLVALLDERPNYPVIVVTNDRELQGRCVALGATIARAEQLLSLIR